MPSLWLYDPVADLAFQSDDPPGTSPLRASRLTRFFPMPGGMMVARAHGYRLGALEDPVEYRPLAAPVRVADVLASTLDAEWSAISVARGAAVANGSGR